MGAGTMTTLSDVLDRDLLAAEVEAAYVKRNRHPSLPISIYAYSRACQYEGRWNEVTRQCRGLIVDDDENIVARPFAKFFNVGEHESDREYADPLPIEAFRVYEKVDGSLGILFNFQGEWIIASKGSFISDQARWANKRLAKQDPADLDLLNTAVTYCAEIVYPENRIVVNYGDRLDFVLLGGFFADGIEVPLENMAPTWKLGSVVTTYGGGDSAAHLAKIMELTASNKQVNQLLADGTNAEGYVIRFESGIRAKAKFAEYVRLHRLLTGVTERDIWRALAFDALAKLELAPKALAQSIKCSVDEVAKMAAAPNGAMATIVDGTPDEFDAWVTKVSSGLTEQATNLAEAGVKTFYKLREDVGTEDRGTFARALQAYTTDKRVQSICFSMLDDRPFDPFIWHSLYPAASTPFKEDDEG